MLFTVRICILAAILAAGNILAQPQGSIIDPPVPPTISGQPVLRYLCPPTDLSGFPVGTVNYAYAAETFFCSYPSDPDENPFTFYCTYHQKTGVLVEDVDVGLCTPQASLGFVNRKRSLTVVHPHVHERHMSDSMKNIRAMKKRQEMKVQLE